MSRTEKELRSLRKFHRRWVKAIYRANTEGGRFQSLEARAVHVAKTLETLLKPVTIFSLKFGPFTLTLTCK